MLLTKRLVGGRQKPARRRSEGGRGARPPLGSRARLVAAAAQQFAARGFAGASVDRIAATARVNKAMIYYHFGSKAALYREILRDMFQAVGARARIAAGSAAPPGDKVGLFVDAIATEAEARPHFPPIWFREVAEGGTHLDAAVLRDIISVVESLAAIMADGVRRGAFRPVSPLLVHGGIVAPLMLFFASAPLRQRLVKAGLKGAAGLQRDDLVDHVRRVTISMLEEPSR